MRPVYMVIALLLAAPAVSEASTPRGYKTVPSGTNLFELIYSYTQGKARRDTPLPGSTLEIHRHTALLRFVHYFDWSGRFSGLSLMLPLADQELSFYNPNVPGATLGEHSGVGDPTLVIASNIFGQPAMGLQQYVERYKSDKPVEQTSLNWSLWVTMPLGKYDPVKIVNAGENRWVAKPEINFTHIAGRFWFEANTAVSFFSENSEYQGVNLEQDPLLTVEGHFSVDVPIRLTPEVTVPAWASLSLYGRIGGETTLSGFERDDAYNDWEVSANLYLRVHREYALRLFYSKTVKHEERKFDIDTAGLRLTYIF